MKMSIQSIVKLAQIGKWIKCENECNSKH